MSLGIVPFPIDRRILTDDHPLLRQTSTRVELFDYTLWELSREMLAIIRGRALGLAAVQIGVTQRVIVTVVDGVERVLVNPEVVRTLQRQDSQIEGCLSVPRDKWRVRPRPAKCDVRWQDPSGTHHQDTFHGLEARVVMHEIDHLDGILVTDWEPA